MGLIAFPFLTAPLWRTEEAEGSFTHSPLEQQHLLRSRPLLVAVK